MRTYDECVGAIIEQINHWRKIGKIDLVDGEDAADAAELALTEEEYDEYSGTAIKEALWSI